MAQKTTVLLVDDIDGGAADETVPFSLDGVSYEIDLSADNAARLRDLLGPYVGAGRRLGGRARTRARRGGSGAGTDSAAVRAWAREQGLQISDRGRIPADIVAQYDAAHH